MKKIFTLLLLIAAAIPLWAEDFSYNGIYYNITDATNKTVEVTYRGDYSSSYYDEYTGSVVIPESVTYDGTTYSVTSIGREAFRYCPSLTEITIPESVTSIGSRAFDDCEGLTAVYINDITAWCNIDFGSSYSNPLCYARNLYLNNELVTELTIPESVTSIRNYAFYECTGLTEVTIPNSVTSIGDWAFAYCTGLTEITIPESVTSIGSGAFYGCTGLTEITIPNSVTSIGGDAFEFCDGLTSVTIGNSVTSIGHGAFWGCTGLTEVTIGNSVTSIGEWAFYECTGLTSITIPNSVTSIGSRAFYGCTGLTEITIPNSVTSIGDEAFYETPYYNNMPDGVVYIYNVLYEYKGTMPANTTIEVREGTVSISSYAFSYCTGLTSITIPNSVTEIGTRAFGNCTGLTSVTIPNSVTSIGDYAFYRCKGLTEVTIPNSVTSIGNYAFQDCMGLTEVTIGSGVTEIGSGAFAGCEGLTLVTIGNSVTEIGDYAFDGCDRIKEVYARPTVPPTIGLYTFSVYVNDNATLYVPQGCKEAYAEADYWEFFMNINANLSGVEGVNVDEYNIVVANGTLIINGVADDATVNIYSLNGALLHSTTAAQVADVALPRGIYLVQVGNVVKKVVR